MILGAAVKNYKVYKNLQYIPISSGQNFTAFLGPNGIGKTSIFEALDKFFNGGEWVHNHDSAKGADESGFIAPLFLVPVNSISFNKKERKVASIISEYFWKYSGTAYAPLISQIKNVIVGLGQHGLTSETHYLFMLGWRHQASEVHIPYFEKDLQNLIDDDVDLDFAADVGDLLKRVKSHYRYIYLPAEADSMDFAKMESFYFQKLLDEDIRKKIHGSISRASIKEINDSLREFVDQINESLDKYAYKGKRKELLTSNDLVDRIFAAYFGTKVLHRKGTGKNDTIIKNLSSGEKRQALIDLSYALLSRSKERGYQVILAIDEPDASMHVLACHDQFEKIAEIPNLCSPKPQVLINTHWYGFIPILRSGIAHSLTRTADGVEFFSFDLENFREHINQSVKSTAGKYPKEIELKSYQDMIQSVVVSMLRSKPYNWIFCEGSSDRVYLDHYLSDMIDLANLRIVPLGGFKQVRRVHAYLLAPLGDKDASFKSKAICLVDTDAQKEHVELNAAVKNLAFKRIVRNEADEKIWLVNVDDQMSFPTEIEFSLREEVFIKVMQDAVSAKTFENFAELKKIVENANKIKGSTNLYDYLNLGPKDKSEIMNKFFDVGINKLNFAKAYVKNDPNREYQPDWIMELRKILGA